MPNTSMKGKKNVFKIKERFIKDNLAFCGAFKKKSFVLKLKDSTGDVKVDVF